MSQVQLELDDEILARAERLAVERGMTEDEPQSARRSRRRSAYLSTS